MIRCFSSLAYIDNSLALQPWLKFCLLKNCQNCFSLKAFCIKPRKKKNTDHTHGPVSILSHLSVKTVIYMKLHPHCYVARLYVQYILYAALQQGDQHFLCNHNGKKKYFAVIKLLILYISYLTYCFLYDSCYRWPGVSFYVCILLLPLVPPTTHIETMSYILTGFSFWKITVQKRHSDL